MSHVTRSRLFGFALGILCTLAVVAALGGVTGVLAGAPAQDPLPPEQEGTAPTSPDGAVDRIIPVQGRLTDAGGSPINGSKSITFTLYTSGGTIVCQDNDPVTVVNGLFNSYMNYCTAANLNGQQLYLGIRIAGEAAEMTPRQPIFPVPYAFSLVPGAQIGGTGAGDGSLFLSDASGSTAISLTAGGANLDLGRAGSAGDISVRNSAGGSRFSVSGSSGGVTVRDAVGAPSFSVSGNSGDVSQALAADGLVKAAAFVYCGTAAGAPTLNPIRSFNHIAGTITVDNGASAGRCTIDFGFDVSDRFVVATVAGSTQARSVTYNTESTVNRLNFYRWDTDGVDAGWNGNISVLVY